MSKYKAQPCPCGHSACKDWHVSPVAAMRGVNFTEEQAKKVATLLNGQRPSVVKPLDWVESYGVMRAETPFGTYMARGNILTFNRVDSVGPEPMERAQADYKSRVLSCLTAPPLDQRAEVIEECAKTMEGIAKAYRLRAIETGHDNTRPIIACNQGAKAIRALTGGKEG